jgi:chromosomal replication initiation ATPase DnaA
MLYRTNCLCPTPSAEAPGVASHLAESNCRLIEYEVAAAFAVPADKLRVRHRGTASIAFARQTAMYLAHVALGLSYTQIGEAFRRDRTTAAYACREVERRRDDPRLDSLLGRLEKAIAEKVSSPAVGNAGR